MFNSDASLLKPHLEKVLALLVNCIANQKKYKTDEEIYKQIIEFVKNLVSADKECHDII